MFVIWCLSYSYKGDSGASVWNQGDSMRKCSRLRHQHSSSRQLAAQLGTSTESVDLQVTERWVQWRACLWASAGECAACKTKTRCRAAAQHCAYRICKQTENVDQSKINLNLVASVSNPVTTAELLYIFQCLVDRLPNCFDFWPTATNLQQTTLALPSVGPSKFYPSVRFLACIREVARDSLETPTIRRSVRGFPQHFLG
jgi:hypothetical protein